MRILSSRTTTSAYIFALLCSTVYWLRVAAGAKTYCLPKNLVAELQKIMPDAEAFCKQHGIPIRSFRSYFTWIAAKAPDTGDKLNTLLFDHLKSLQGSVTQLRTDSDITSEELSVISQIRTWHRSESAATLESLRTKVSSLGMPSILLPYFKAETQDPAPLVNDLRALVKTMTGKAALQVPLEDTASLRESKPALWAQYLALRKNLVLMYKQELREYVRDSGGPVDIAAARKHFVSLGIPSQLPHDFVGLVTETGSLLTSDGQVLKTHTGGDVSVIDPQAKITMNPKYDAALDKVPGKNKGNWVFKAVLPTINAASGAENTQYFYTGNRMSQTRQHKFGVVQKLVAREAQMVRAWRRDLMGKDWDKKIKAAQCELVYETCARVGGSRSETFGLTTLLVGNIKRKGTSIVIEYVGKGNASQRHIVKPETPALRQVIAVLETLCEGRVRKDLLWQYEGRKYTVLKLRDYFRQVSGVPEATPHKLRHLRGTRLATSELEETKAALLKRKTITQTLVDTAFKAALTTVGKLLGHVKGIGVAQVAVWSTAAKNYVEPSVMTDFYESFLSYGVRVPAFLLKIKE